MRKILIMGLPGAGKTTLAAMLKQRLNAVHFNADEIRTNINKDLGFSEADRVEQATRMGWLCDRVVEAGGFAIADFICPTVETRKAFFRGGDGAIIWVDRIAESIYPDTDALFVPPMPYDLRVNLDHTPEYWAERVCMIVRPVFNWRKPTALFVGRYQPFHQGHKALIVRGMNEIGQACIAVRDVKDAANPFDFEYVRARIEHALHEYTGRFVVLALPNVAAIFYGRDVGYRVERIELDAATEAVSGTNERAKQNGGNRAGAGDGEEAVI